MASTSSQATPVRRNLLLDLLAQGVIAAIGLAVGAVVGLFGAFWLGLIEISC